MGAVEVEVGVSSKQGPCFFFFCFLLEIDFTSFYLSSLPKRSLLDILSVS